ncbi:MAG: hypothetical protein U1E17_09160 [Geminicoccaceae bacterium]
MGWVAFVSFGAVYYLVPRPWKCAAALFPTSWSSGNSLGRDAGHRPRHHGDGSRASCRAWM